MRMARQFHAVNTGKARSLMAGLGHGSHRSVVPAEDSLHFTRPPVSDPTRQSPDRGFPHHPSPETYTLDPTLDQ